MSGNIFNSNGAHVGVVEGAAILDLKGEKSLSSQRDEYLSTFRRTGRSPERGARLR